MPQANGQIRGRRYSLPSMPSNVARTGGGFVRQFVCLFVCMSVCLSMSVCLYVCLSVHVSLFVNCYRFCVSLLDCFLTVIIV